MPNSLQGLGSFDSYCREQLTCMAQLHPRGQEVLVGEGVFIRSDIAFSEWHVRQLSGKRKAPC